MKHINWIGAFFILAAFAVITVIAERDVMGQRFGGSDFSFGSQSSEVSSEPVVIKAEFDEAEARASGQRVIAVVAEMAYKYHINPEKSQIPKDMSYLIPTTISVNTKDAPVKTGDVQYPKANDVEVNYTGTPSSMKAYEGETVFYVPMIVNDNAKPGEYAISVVVDYQTCNDRACLPPETKTIDLKLNIVGANEAIAGIDGGGSNSELFAGFDSTAFQQLMSGGIGIADGCVFTCLDGALILMREVWELYCCWLLLRLVVFY